MLCPYCGTEMEAGYLNGTNVLFWGPHKDSTYGSPGTFELNEMETREYGCMVTSHYCEACGLLLSYPVKPKTIRTWKDLADQTARKAKKAIKALKKEDF